MSNRGWIAYVGSFRFPEGEAGSRRVLGIARSIASAGYRVVVGSGDSEPQSPSRLCNDSTSASIDHIGLRELLPAGASNLARSVRYLLTFGRLTVKWLDAQTPRPSAVILYGCQSPYMLRLLPWCRRNNIPLITDIVEWYDPRQVMGGLFGPFYMSSQLAMRQLAQRSDGIIAVSSLLKDHYSNLGCRVIRIPPTLDVQGIAVSSCPERDASRITLVYSGTPGRKDLLGSVIRAVRQVDPAGREVRLLVVGPSETQVARLLGESGPLPDCIQLVGRLPHHQAMKTISQADFSVLLRPSMRYANAGFPTKLVESFCSGTPIICNITSDLGQYVHDGLEGIVCRDHTPDGFAEGLRRALALSPVRRGDMRRAARKQAEESFDYRRYAKPIGAFLGEICG